MSMLVLQMWPGQSPANAAALGQAVVDVVLQVQVGVFEEKQQTCCVYSQNSGLPREC